MLQAFIESPSIQVIIDSPRGEAVVDAGVVLHFDEFSQQPTSQFENATGSTNLCNIDMIPRRELSKFASLLNTRQKEVAYRFLGTIVNQSAGCRDFLLLEGDMMNPLLGLLDVSTKTSILRPVTWTVANFCGGKLAPDFELVRSSLPTLARLILSQEEDEEVLEHVCRALRYLSDGSGDKIKAVIDAGVGPRLVELLRNASPAVQAQALRTIGNMLIGSEQQIKFLVEQGCVRPLCDFLTRSDPMMVTIALEGLENILKVGEDEARVTDGLNDITAYVSDADGLKKIEGLWLHSNDAVSEKCMAILVTYFPVEDEEVPGQFAVEMGQQPHGEFDLSGGN